MLFFGGALDEGKRGRLFVRAFADVKLQRVGHLGKKAQRGARRSCSEEHVCYLVFLTLSSFFLTLFSLRIIVLFAPHFVDCLVSFLHFFLFFFVFFLVFFLVFLFFLGGGGFLTWTEPESYFRY